jgi:hypothetical protein
MIARIFMAGTVLAVPGMFIWGLVAGGAHGIAVGVIMAAAMAGMIAFTGYVNLLDRRMGLPFFRLDFWRTGKE